MHWDRKIDALLAQALMSIQAVKGSRSARASRLAGLRGSDAHDAICWRRPTRRRYRREHTNPAGGIEGGISTGGLVVARVHEAAGDPQPARRSRRSTW